MDDVQVFFDRVTAVARNATSDLPSFLLAWGVTLGALVVLADFQPGMAISLALLILLAMLLGGRQ